MRAKYRAYALTEMLMIIVVFAVLIGLSVRPFRAMIVEIPRSAEACRTLGPTFKALEQIKKDVEQATGEITLKNDTLTLDHKDGLVAYTFADGQITRCPGLNASETEFTWTLPDVRMQAKLWNQDSKFCAVELTTWSRQIDRGRERSHFKQTMVFFQKGIQQ